jgi:hypothetical protein
MDGLLTRAAIALMMLAPALGIAADKKDPPQVRVESIRNPVDKSYRRMIDGMDLFDANHELAPQANLRFRLLPRQPDVDMNGIVLKVVGDTFSTVVPLAPDNSFSIERDARAQGEDASLIPNRRALSMTWRAQVRTPGLAENVRRLGDLRLECIVGIQAGLISNHAKSQQQQEARMLARRGSRACDEDFNYLLFAERPLFSATLRDGKRTEVLAFNRLYGGGGALSDAELAHCDCQVLQDKTYYAPLADKSWSDDTLIEFTYMNEGPVTPAPAVAAPAAAGKQPEHTINVGISTKADVSAALGPAHAVPFKTGYEVWLYTFEILAPETITVKGHTDLIILFGPDGIVRQLRRNKSAVN